MAVLADGQVVLGGLEILRQVRVVVVLAVEFAEAGDLAVQRKARAHGKFEDFLVQDRQDPGQAEAYRAYVGVGFRTERCLAAAENLRRGAEFRVDFQSDDGFVFHASISPFGAVLVNSGWACSKA